MAAVQHRSPAPESACPCGRLDAQRRPLGWTRCCGRYIDGGEAAPDAEALMRSRYSAFVLERQDHLRATWHPAHCPDDLSPVPGTRWLGLEVRAHRPLDADHAEVEFVARYRIGGRAVRLHERSRFVREQGRRLYLDGQQP